MFEHTLSPHLSTLLQHFPSPLLLVFSPHSFTLLHTVSGCLQGQLAAVVYHHYWCFHMNAQTHMYISFLHAWSLTMSLWHTVPPGVFPSHPLHTRRECLWVCVFACVRKSDVEDRERRGEERRGEALLVLYLCWIKPWWGIAWGRHPRQKQACFPPLFVEDPSGGRRRKRERWESQQSAWERKVCRREREMCWCVCLCVAGEDINRRGGAGPQSVPTLSFVSRNKPPQKPTQLCRKKTENNNKSKRRTSLLSPNPLSQSDCWWE